MGSVVMAAHVFLWLAISSCFLHTQAAPHNIHIRLYGISVTGGEGEVSASVNEEGDNTGNNGGTNKQMPGDDGAGNRQIPWQAGGGGWGGYRGRGMGGGGMGNLRPIFYPIIIS